jgi:hypothetical protein
VEDDGRINIASSDDVAPQKAIAIIQELTATPEQDKVNMGRVERITDFGAFIEVTRRGRPAPRRGDGQLPRGQRPRRAQRRRDGRSIRVPAKRTRLLGAVAMTVASVVVIATVVRAGIATAARDVSSHTRREGLKDRYVARFGSQDREDTLAGQR